jgi:hypothetical protein
MELQSLLVPLGNGRSLTLVWSGGECFAQVPGLSFSFDLSSNGFRGYLSKMKVATVKNEELKRALGLSGKVRFLDRDGLSSVLDDRIKDESILAAAKLMLIAPPVAAIAPRVVPVAPPAVAALPPRADVIEEESVIQEASNTDENIEAPIIVHPRPVPIAREQERDAAVKLPITQELTLPTGDAWYDSDEYCVGKSYILPSFDRGEPLLHQLRDLREFWTAERMPSRRSEALSLVTFDKRESRVLLYLGFLRLIKALDEPKRLTLNACLNHRAVYAFAEWLEKGRESSYGNLVEYLSAFVSVAKFLYQNSDEKNIEIVQRLRELRNRFQTKQARVHKTEDDLQDEGRWLSWSTFEEAVVALQSQFTELIAEEEAPTKCSGRVLHDLLLLRYYAACPSRSGEVRLLQLSEKTKNDPRF